MRAARLLPLLISALVGCTSSAATEPSGQTTPAQPIAAAELPLGRWLVVRATTGRGLTEGSGVRLRADGFDVVSGTLSQAMDGECVTADAELRCSGVGGDMVAVAQSDGTVAMQQGPIALTLAAAGEDEAARFERTLTEGDAQRRACGAAAQCCIAAENQLGIACDLNALLGDRSLAACTVGLATARERLRGAPLPPECE